MFTKRRISPSSSRSRSPIPGYWASSALRQSATVPEVSRVTVVSLLVRARSVLGMRTLTAMLPLDDISFYRVDPHAERRHRGNRAVDCLLRAIQLQHDPAFVFGDIGAPDVRDDVVFHAHVVDHRLLDQVRREGEFDAGARHSATTGSRSRAASASSKELSVGATCTDGSRCSATASWVFRPLP